MSDKTFYGPQGDGTAYVLREADPAYPLHILMLHGWSGDERVMWVLESVLPEGAPVASLRGSFALAGEGFEWTDQRASINTAMHDFSAAIETVKSTLSKLVAVHSFDEDRLVLMGFSQGAALSFAIAETLERSPLAVISLAGFLPEGSLSRLLQIPIFWGHGTRDDLVPVERARADVAMLESNGAQVHYCETDVGHKLGIECTRGLKGWLLDLEDRREG